jgi:2-C-methyl-D-erythritol 2,4-cyclodiphosphate synthase
VSISANHFLRTLLSPFLADHSSLFIDHCFGVFMRIGFGYDVHRLVPGRKLILGGVEIAHPQGLEGHSDADVLLHAICDGILGALGDGDIGRHFPNTDPRYRGISSLVLLQTVAARVVERNLQVNNIDSTIIAEEPRIAPYVSQMAENIAGALKISPGAVNIKATTSERLGFVGEGRGLVAFAVVLLDSPGKSGPI